MKQDTTFLGYDVPAHIRAELANNLIKTHRAVMPVERAMAIAALELALWWCNDNMTKATSPDVQVNAQAVIRLWVEGLGYRFIEAA